MTIPLTIVGGAVRRSDGGGGGGGTDPFFADTLFVANYAPPKDESSNALEIHMHGDSLQEPTGKFGKGYRQFIVGNTNQFPWLEVQDSAGVLDLGASDFVIELWIAASTEPTSGYLFCNGLRSSAPLGYQLEYEPTNNFIRFQASTDGGTSLNASLASFAVGVDGVDLATLWDGNYHHIAVERDGTTITVYVDGIAGATTWAIGAATINDADTIKVIGNVGGIAIATFYRGALDELRVTIGATRYGGAFTPPASSFTADANTELLVSFDDDFGPTHYGQTTVTTIQMFADLTDRIMDNNGLYATTSAGQGVAYQTGVAGSWSLGTGDFCVEAFGVDFESTANRETIMGVGDHFFDGVARTWRWHFDASNNLLFTMFDSSNVEHALTFGTTFATDGTTYDLCVERVGTTVTAYVDGVSDGTATISANTRTDSTLPLGIHGGGTGTDETDQEFLGHLKAARITVGSARYEGAYTPPSVPLPTD